MVSCGSVYGSVASGTSDPTGAIFGGMLFWIVIIVSWIGSMILAWYSIQKYNTNSLSEDALNRLNDSTSFNRYISFGTSHKERFDKKREEALVKMNEAIKNAEEF